MLRLLVFLMILPPVFISGQEPFVCAGDYYLTLRGTGYSELFRINIDPQTKLVTFNRVDGLTDGHDLNAMGYRITDNLIYVIDQQETTLVSIDATGTIRPLRVLSEIPVKRYFAGACTPDGNYLVLSGSPFDFGIGSSNDNLIFIDLRDPSYPTREVLLRDNPFLFFDMAFDPFTGICYAYDRNIGQLITVNINSGTVAPVGASGQPASSMGTLFFDTFGNLYGYGRPTGSDFQNTLFAINKETGDLTALTMGETADRTDGCSCPFTIKVSKDAFPRNAVPCTEVTYTFVLANASGVVREHLTFSDIMPEGFEVIDIIDNPFGGTRRETGKPNELIFDDMLLPLGVDSLIVKVRIGEGLEGHFPNQARLDNLPEALGGFTLSDDPTTLVPGDPTSVWVTPLDVDLRGQNRLLCPQDTLVLTAGPPGVSYRWHDGSVEATFVVSGAGTYFVEAKSGCTISFDTIVVESSPNLEVSLGPDREVLIGDSILLVPDISGTGPYSYKWDETNLSASTCETCPEIYVQPFVPTTYEVAVTDGFGCMVIDKVEILVDRNLYVYIPNAFTPNGDGINDYFFIAGRFPYPIRTFEIYSRWGQRLFENKKIMVNSEFEGWNGFAGDQLMTPGVYVWKAVFEFADGSVVTESGDVTLIR